MTKKPILTDEEERALAEKITGCQFGKPFFVYKGFSLTAQGDEAPDVFLELEGKRMVLQEDEIKIFREAFFQALKWTKEGWCPGASF